MPRWLLQEFLLRQDHRRQILFRTPVGSGSPFNRNLQQRRSEAVLSPRHRAADGRLRSPSSIPNLKQVRQSKGHRVLEGSLGLTWARTAAWFLQDPRLPLAPAREPSTFLRRDPAQPRRRNLTRQRRDHSTATLHPTWTPEGVCSPQTFIRLRTCRDKHRSISRRRSVGLLLLLKAVTKGINQCNRRDSPSSPCTSSPRSRYHHNQLRSNGRCSRLSKFSNRGHSRLHRRNSKNNSRLRPSSRNKNSKSRNPSRNDKGQRRGGGTTFPPFRCLALWIRLQLGNREND